MQQYSGPRCRCRVVIGAKTLGGAALGAADEPLCATVGLGSAVYLASMDILMPRGISYSAQDMMTTTKHSILAWKVLRSTPVNTSSQNQFVDSKGGMQNTVVRFSFPTT